MKLRLLWKVEDEEHWERDKAHHCVEKKVECGRIPNGTLEEKKVKYKNI